MSDADSTLADLKTLVRHFVEERAWQPFHSPKNLAMGIAVEAAELMECFLWLDLPASHEAAKEPKQREAIADEMADVFCYLLNLSNVLGIDLSEAAARGKDGREECGQISRGEISRQVSGLGNLEIQ